MNHSFSHIYVEKNVKELPLCKKIINNFPQATIIEIDHYKDVFCRNKQNFAIQKEAPALILAKKEGNLLYKGSTVCQSFGNSYFYYTSCIMNCIYSCSYCYLSGMYPSGNIVMFLNLEDYFDEIKELLKQHPLYICVSYDTDLLALNSITGFLNKWIEFTDNCENLTIEIRTKCGNISSLEEALAHCTHKERIIFAYTLSPDEIIKKHELHTSSLMARLQALDQLMQAGFSCRIAFDPMIYDKNWRQYYSQLADIIFYHTLDSCKIDVSRLIDVSIGTFRISSTYLKNMRKNYKNSAITQFPYQLDDGVFHYPDEIMQEMEAYMYDRCLEFLPKEKIFLWKE